MKSGIMGWIMSVPQKCLCTVMALFPIYNAEKIKKYSSALFSA